LYSLEGNAAKGPAEPAAVSLPRIFVQLKNTFSSDKMESHTIRLLFKNPIQIFIFI
jgi:hypothetical protein